MAAAHTATRRILIRPLLAPLYPALVLSDRVAPSAPAPHPRNHRPYEVSVTV
jgi:hypothetical protein